MTASTGREAPAAGAREAQRDAREDERGPGRDSPWQAALRGRYPTLEGVEDAEVAVVGAGIAGLTAALQLASAGPSVIAMEAQYVGTGATGSTSAHLSARPDISFRELLGRLGVEDARLVWESGVEAIDHIERTCREEAIDCGFTRVDDWLLARSSDQQAVVESEVQACRTLGIPSATAGRPPLDALAWHHLGSQGRFHPGQYLHGLALAATRRGARLYERSRVAHMEPSPGGNGWTLTTSAAATVLARRVVVATHTPVLTEYPLLHQLKPQESFVVGALAPKGAAPDVLAYDAEDPYHYYRIEPYHDHDLVMLGGEDRKTGAGPQEVNAQRYDALEQTLRAWLPHVPLRFVHRWMAEEFVTENGLPIIGPDHFATHPGRFVATGFAGTGLTWGTLAGVMAADWVTGRASRYAELFAPRRYDADASDLEGHAREHADEMRRDESLGTPPAAVERLQPGEGTLLRDRGGDVVAVYRDETGIVHRLAGTCTHRGCPVHWNAAARTWDCHCHGSRFQATGAVHTGPAVEPLARQGT